MSRRGVCLALACALLAADGCHGGNGNDTLTDTSGNDILNGSNGSDTINAQDSAGGDIANGGNGTDTCTTDPGDITTSC